MPRMLRLSDVGLRRGHQWARGYDRSSNGQNRARKQGTRRLILRRRLERLDRRVVIVGQIPVIVTVSEESILELVIHAYVPSKSKEFVLHVTRDDLQALELDADQDELRRLQSFDAFEMVLPVLNRLSWRSGRLALRKSGGSGRLVFKGCIHAGNELVILRVYKNPWGLRIMGYLPSTCVTYKFELTSRECSEMLGDCSWSQKGVWIERLRGRIFFRHGEIVLSRRIYAEARKISGVFMQLEAIILSEGWLRIRAYDPKASNEYALDLDDTQVYELATQKMTRKDGGPILAPKHCGGSCERTTSYDVSTETRQQRSSRGGRSRCCKL